MDPEEMMRRHEEEMRKMQQQFASDMDDMRAAWDEDTEREDDLQSSEFREPFEEAARAREELLEEQLRRLEQWERNARGATWTTDDVQRERDAEWREWDPERPGEGSSRRHREETEQRDRRWQHFHEKMERDFEQMEKDAEEEHRKRWKAKMDDVHRRGAKGGAQERGLGGGLIHKHNEQWADFEAWAGTVGRSITMADIPFLQGEVLRRANHARFFGMVGPKQQRDLVRKLLVRWHPDKFQQKFGSRLDPACKADVLARVTTISQALNLVGDP